jgi:putative DNA primase/helicase
MARAAPKQRFDIDALSLDVAERFDAVRWGQFNSSDNAERNETRMQVLDIRKDLLQVAAVDPALAGRVWDEHVPGYVPRPAELPAAELTPDLSNTIEPGRRRRKAQAEPYLEGAAPSAETREDTRQKQTGPAPKVEAASPAALAPESEDARAARQRLLLEALEKQYILADDKYHFRDRTGEVAFHAQDKRLMTSFETPSVVASMVDLAEARGWSSLKLSGTQDFKREAWLQASLRDIETSGYKPTELDKARLEEIRSERQPAAPANTLTRMESGASGRHRFEPHHEDGQPEPKIPMTPKQDQALKVLEAIMKERGDSPAAIAAAHEVAVERLRSDRVYAGKLIQVGHGPYQDKPGEKLSPFIVLEDDKGARNKVWGVDFPRALGEADAKIGETLAVVYKGRHPVTVDVPVKDKAGKVVAMEPTEVVRNSWEVVQLDRLRKDAQVKVMEAVKRQEDPGKLKVFDRSAPSTRRPMEVERYPGRARERAMG